MIQTCATNFPAVSFCAPAAGCPDQLFFFHNCRRMNRTCPCGDPLASEPWLWACASVICVSVSFKWNFVAELLHTTPARYGMASQSWKLPRACRYRTQSWVQLLSREIKVCWKLIHIAFVKLFWCQPPLSQRMKCVSRNRERDSEREREREEMEEISALLQTHYFFVFLYLF